MKTKDGKNSHRWSAGPVRCPDAVNRLDIAIDMSNNLIMAMKRLQVLLLLAFSLILFSCAPVLNREYMREGSREVSFQLLRESPDPYKGRLFIFGGVIVRTKVTAAGSQIEAMHVPVDSSGYFKETGSSEGRFIAVLPGDGTLLDPEVYRRGRRVTLAGEFVELRKGRIDEIEYVYPVFEIKQIYLWPRERPYYYYYDDPWFYPYYYWGPWWYYPYYYRYYPYYPEPPVYRRTPPPTQPPPRTPEPQPHPRREPERER
jgi:outer membrane lipoprotein